MLKNLNCIYFFKFLLSFFFSSSVHTVFWADIIILKRHTPIISPQAMKPLQVLVGSNYLLWKQKEKKWNTSKSPFVFRWHIIPSLNKTSIVFLSSCQTSKACKQETVSPSIAVTQWCLSDMELQDQKGRRRVGSVTSE